MNEQMLTAGAWRALELAWRLARELDSPRVEPLHLLCALLLEESRASELLAERGLRRAALDGLCPLDEATLNRLAAEAQALAAPADRPATGVASPASGMSAGGPAVSGSHAPRDGPLAALSESLQGVVLEARRQAGRSGRETEVGSEHLLWGLAAGESAVAMVLKQAGLDQETLAGHITEPRELTGEPIATDVRLEAAGAVSTAGEPKIRGAERPENRLDVLRVLDAAANRAREGLRVLEDYVRFVLDDAHLTRLLKDARHSLAAHLADLFPPPSPPETLRPCEASNPPESATRLLAARDTQGDVGTAIHTDAEASRTSLGSIVLANFKRAQEALRTLEEFGKLLAPEIGAALGQLRYRLYTLEKAVTLTWHNRERLAGCRLYLLVTSALCRRDVETVIRGVLAGGVDAVQLREKPAVHGSGLTDRELVSLGRRIRGWTRESGALFIMNDRPDLAVVCDADGVHVGQDELAVRAVRRVVGPDRLVGVSTHTIEQARQAVLDGADYLGVGPVFPSSTKEFESLAGLGFVRQVASEITLPWFAIGGVSSENVQDVLAAGATRIAVSGAICSADDPQHAAQKLRERVVSSREPDNLISA